MRACFADLPGVELVGVADPDRSQRELVSGVLGCATFAGVDGLLAHGVDAVTIAAPTHLHQDLALVCIERGVHVMVEKPIASRWRRAARSSPPPAASASR